jgi:hypothetical protein
MRLGSLASARPAAYDRNQSTVLKSFSSFAVGPHAYVTRWTQTIASGKRAVVTSAQIWTQRFSAATSIGQLLYEISVTPSGGSGVPFLYIIDNDNTVNRVTNVVMSSGPYLQAGDVLYCNTQDSSTGGTVNIATSGSLALFDA